MQQTDSAIHKLKPRSFHKSTQLWANLADFHLWYELHLIVKISAIVSKLKAVDSNYFHFFFISIFFLIYFYFILFLELGLGLE